LFFFLFFSFLFQDACVSLYPGSAITVGASACPMTWKGNDTCGQEHGNWDCTTCSQRVECGWCSSTVTSTCFQGEFQGACGSQFFGQWNGGCDMQQCSARHTTAECPQCVADGACNWCDRRTSVGGNGYYSFCASPQECVSAGGVSVSVCPAGWDATTGTTGTTGTQAIWPPPSGAPTSFAVANTTLAGGFSTDSLGPLGFGDFALALVVSMGVLCLCCCVLLCTFVVRGGGNKDGGADYYY
jgi:hypothetical protein